MSKKLKRLSENARIVYVTLMEAIDGDRRAQKAIRDVATGMGSITESITTSDFPGLFQQAINAQVEAEYPEVPSLWREWAKQYNMNGLRKENFIELLADFSNLPDENGGVSTLPGGLPRIPEGTPFPAIAFTGSEKDVWTYKFGGRVGFTWEGFSQDQWNVLGQLPGALVRQAKRTEDLSATSILFNKSTGWNTSIFGSVTSKALTFQNLLEALAVVRSTSDPQKVNTQTKWALMVPRALVDTAEAIIAAVQVEQTVGSDKLIVPNRVGNRAVVVENPYLDVMPGTGYTKTDTSWALLPYAGDGGGTRTTIVQTFISGRTEPELRIKNDQGQALGGGSLSPYEGSFDTDDIQIRARHFTNSVAINTDLGFYASSGS